MMRRPLLWALVILMVMSFPAISSAQRRRERDRDDDDEQENVSSAVLRDHLVTVSSFTLERGEFEMDISSRFAKGQRGTDSLDYWAHSAEAEFGLTRRWMIGLGADFQQPNAGKFTYTGLEAETRYRLKDPGKWFLNPAVALDYELPKDSKVPKSLGGTLILDKETKGLGVVLNGTYEQELKSGEEGEFGYAAGLFKSLTKAWSAGVEFTGNFSEDEQAHYAVPGIYFSPGEELKLDLGASIGLTDESEPFGVRAFLELEFE